MLAKIEILLDRPEHVDLFGVAKLLVTGFAGSGRSIYSDKVRTGPATSPDPR